MGGGVQSYLKPLYVFCNETGIFDLEEAARWSSCYQGKESLAETMTSCVLRVSNTCLTGFLLETPYIGPVFNIFFL